eukprot:Tamp_06613.p1 GENE.Tamp_06613~~Tamp_06613.p1  ORF type:complete len:316 (+),score=64.52 Tamp_06613:1199-2146(+)
MYLYLKGHGAMTDVSVLEGTRSYATALALHPDSSPHAQGGTSADELGSEDVSEESDSTGGASAPAEQQLQEQAASQPDHPAAAGVTAPTSASIAASTHVLGAATSASQESLHAPSAAVGGSSIGAGEAGAAAGSARPVSIEEFCAVNGLSSYVGKMLENEIELDVLPGLSEEDWEEIGIMADDMPRLLDAIACMQPEPADAEEEEVTEALEVATRKKGTGDPPHVSEEEEDFFPVKEASSANAAQAPAASRSPPSPALPAPPTPCPAEAEAPELESARLDEDAETSSAQEIALLEAEQERIASVQALMMREGWSS